MWDSLGSDSPGSGPESVTVARASNGVVVIRNLYRGNLAPTDVLQEVERTGGERY